MRSIHEIPILEGRMQPSMFLPLVGKLSVLLLVSAVLVAQAPKKRPVQPATSDLTLALVETVVSKSEMSHMFVNPQRCDQEGNIYFQIDLEPTSGVRKLSPKGQRLANFTASSTMDFQVWHALRFAIAPDGTLYQLADQSNGPERLVLTFDKGGNYKSAVKLEPAPGFQYLSTTQIAAFASGELLISGEKYNLRPPRLKLPFTGIFDSNGTFRKEVTLSDDDELSKMIASGDPRVIGEHETHRAIDLSQAEGSGDGNVYLMRWMSPAIIYAISPAGEVIRRFTVDPGSPDYVPDNMQIAGERLAILFRDDQGHRNVLKVVDLEGHEMATYNVPNGQNGYPEFGAFACYSINPERFTFMSSDDDGFVGFQVAEPR